MKKNAPLFPESAESKTDKLDLSMLARTAANPAMTEAVAWLQSQAGDALTAIIEQMAESLPSNPPKTGKGQSMQEMVAASRHIARDAQQRRELAEDLVIGALLNRDNPDWDPRNPATHRPNLQSPLIQLLQTKIGGQQA